MRRIAGIIIAAALVLAGVQGATAQATQAFSPTALPSAFSVTSSSSRIAFPSPGPTALIVNTSTTVPVYLNMGSSTVTSATTDYLLAPGCSVAYSISGKPYLAGITTGGTAALQVSTGTGLPTLAPNTCYIPVSFIGTTSNNLAQVNGATVNVGVGASGSGTQRVTTSSDSTLGLAAGSAIIGKVGIDQTAPGTTNAVSTTNFPPTVSTGTGAQGASSPRVTVATDTATIAGSAPGTAAAPSTNALSVVRVPSAASAAGVASVQSPSVETGHVIKASAGNLYDFEVSADATLSAAAWAVMIFNSTTVPAAGAVTPTKCYLLPAGATSYSGAFPTPLYLGTGISIAASTGATCFTKTDSAHAFISAGAQ